MSQQIIIKLSVLATLLLSFQVIPTAFSRTKHIPSGSSKLRSWIGQNIKEFLERKSQSTRGNNATVVDEVLAYAEDHVRVITVNKDGSGDFTTVSAAGKSNPSGNKRSVIVRIGGGECWEKITVECSKKFITLYRDLNDMPKIVYNGNAFEYGTVYRGTVAVERDYFMAVNVAFVVHFLFASLYFCTYVSKLNFCSALCLLACSLSVFRK